MSEVSEGGGGGSTRSTATAEAAESQSQSEAAVMDFNSVTKWTPEEVTTWGRSKGHSEALIQLLFDQRIDGKSLLLLTESDLRQPPIQIQVLGDLKRLYFDILELQQACLPHHAVFGNGSVPFLYFTSPGHFESEESYALHSHSTPGQQRQSHRKLRRKKRRTSLADSMDSQSQGSRTGGDGEPSSLDEIPSFPNLSGVHRSQGQSSHHRRPVLGGYATNLEAEAGKALMAMGYVFVVTWITALVMVIVHDRVPDMQKYPPLPDLFLDNMPHIPWAFEMCEVTGTVLFCIWMGVLFFHKHRFILVRRFFALSGTVFLLRCVTMLITSLSVPGTHLKCNPRPYGDWFSRLYNAYLIWIGAGMSIQGVRTCGDYMFSGHTVALTMLNFFVTEYTTRRLYFVHTLSWLLNMFGIFFILAAHEHYSIDVFIAFYITSRLFLYYHTLANNQALMQRDSTRTKVWFPLFSYFEARVNGIVPNVYEWPITPERLKSLFIWALKSIESKWKDLIHNPNEGLFRVKTFFKPKVRKYDE